LTVQKTGGSLPMKAETNAARRLAREQALRNGLIHHQVEWVWVCGGGIQQRCLQAGRHEQAHHYFRQAVSINFDMMRRFQKYLDEIGVVRSMLSETNRATRP
jgi:hypothetical protein